MGSLDRFGLLSTHGERLVMSSREPESMAELRNRRLDVFRGAAHPLSRTLNNYVLKSFVNKSLTNLEVSEAIPVFPLGRLVDVEGVRLPHLPLRLSNT